MLTFVFYRTLAGNQKPDFRTLNGFRGKLLKGVMEEIFVTAVKMLAAKGYIKLEHYFVDGTKIESASGRYTFVWKRAVETNNKKLDEKLRAYIRTADEAWGGENSEYGDRGLEGMGGKEGYTGAGAKGLAGVLRERLGQADEEGSKKKRKKEIQAIGKGYLPRKKKYEKAGGICGKRDSYSKTDPGAAFMRMKEGRMRNGRLKPGYNVQIGTENGFAAGYDLFPNPAGTKTLKPHVRRQAKRLGVRPKAVTAGAGYGGQENYACLENKGTAAVIKHGMYRKEGSRKRKTGGFKTDNWEYNKKGKYYACPDGRRLTCREAKKRKTGSGYLITVGRYECGSCK
jgi:hypothetical protein